MKRSIVLLCFFLSIQLYGQDVIVMKDGSTVLSKVIEVEEKEVKYKKHSNIDGPVYTIKKENILSINYENGERDDYGDVRKQEENQHVKSSVLLGKGTNIPVQLLNNVKATDVQVGQNLGFKVASDIIVDGVKVIPNEALVTGIVYESKRSSWWGTRGRLGVLIKDICLPNGETIPVRSGDIYVKGKNRTALSVLLFCFVTIPACFVCGGKAMLPSGYTMTVEVANDVAFDKDGNPLYGTRMGNLEDENFYPLNADIEMKNGLILKKVVVLYIDDEVVIYKSKKESSGTERELKRKDIKVIMY